MTIRSSDKLVIKNYDLHVLYSGSGSAVPRNLQDKEVLEIALCDDSEAITIFIK